MSNLVRGGQVTLHNIRMLVQVVKVLSKIGFLLFLISISPSPNIFEAHSVDSFPSKFIIILVLQLFAIVSATS